MAYKVQITRMNFTQAALNMQMGFIRKQSTPSWTPCPVLSVFQPSPPPSAIIISPGLLPQRYFLCVSFLYIFHITKTTKKVFELRYAALEELYFFRLLNSPSVYLPFNLGLLDETFSILISMLKLLSLTMSYAPPFLGRNSLSWFQLSHVSL